MDRITALHKQYGFSIEGFCRMAMSLAEPSLTPLERADRLVGMGCIARYSEPILQFEDSGWAYFEAAIRLAPDHWQANLEVLTLFKELPDGHDDEQLAIRCLQIVEHRVSELTERERQFYDGALTTLGMHGVDVGRLRALKP